MLRILLVLLAAPCLIAAQETTSASFSSDFFIDAPTEVEPGDLIHLDANGFNSPPYSWRFVNPPSDKDWKVGRDGSELFASIKKPGIYYVVLSFVDSEQEIKVPILVLHSFTVKGEIPKPGPTPDPDDPVTPEPIIPDGKYKLAKLSYDEALKISSKPKLPELVEVYRSIASQIRAGGLKGDVAIGTATRNRLQESLGNAFDTWKPWGQAISLQLNSLASSGKLISDDGYAEAYAEIATGLEILLAKEGGK